MPQPSRLDRERQVMDVRHLRGHKCSFQPNAPAEKRCETLAGLGRQNFEATGALDRDVADGLRAGSNAQGLFRLEVPSVVLLTNWPIGWRRNSTYPANELYGREVVVQAPGCRQLASDNERRKDR